MHGTLRYDHYRVLGIPRDASPQQVKQAYRDRVKACHPDRNASPRACALFHAVHEAYETLRDAERRRHYDERLAGYRPAAQAAAPTAMHRPMRQPTTRNHRPVNRFAFIGLHVTGLCFGIAMVSSTLVGVTFLEWPLYVVLFCIPGLVVIPDSIDGLRAGRPPRSSE